MSVGDVALVLVYISLDWLQKVTELFIVSDRYSAKVHTYCKNRTSQKVSPTTTYGDRIGQVRIHWNSSRTHPLQQEIKKKILILLYS